MSDLDSTILELARQQSDFAYGTEMLERRLAELKKLGDPEFPFGIVGFLILGTPILYWLEGPYSASGAFCTIALLVLATWYDTRKRQQNRWKIEAEIIRRQTFGPSENSSQ